MEENTGITDGQSHAKDEKINLVGIAIILYTIVGFIYLIYLEFWGPTPYQSFAWHLGQSLLWPFAMFPTLGKIIGGIIIVIVFGAIALS